MPVSARVLPRDRASDRACSARKGALALVAALVAVYVACCVTLLGRAAPSAESFSQSLPPPPQPPSSQQVPAHQGWALPSLLFAPWRSLRAGAAPPSEEEAEKAEKARVRAELGRGTWSLLHRMAAKFPKDPTPEERARVERFFGDLGSLYPCEDCASHFRGVLAARPVAEHSGNNARLSLWLCAAHNDVNARLGKPLFACELDAIKERWGSCGCFGNATAAPGGAVVRGVAEATAS